MAIKAWWPTQVSQKSRKVTNYQPVSQSASQPAETNPKHTKNTIAKPNVNPNPSPRSTNRNVRGKLKTKTKEINWGAGTIDTGRSGLQSRCGAMAWWVWAQKPHKPLWPRSKDLAMGGFVTRPHRHALKNHTQAHVHRDRSTSSYQICTPHQWKGFIYFLFKKWAYTATNNMC